MKGSDYFFTSCASAWRSKRSPLSLHVAIVDPINRSKNSGMVRVMLRGVSSVAPQPGCQKQACPLSDGIDSSKSLLNANIWRKWLITN
jgi:hypothetical protein